MLSPSPESEDSQYQYDLVSCFHLYNILPIRVDKVQRLHNNDPHESLLNHFCRINVSSTYFVEYQFPVVAASRDQTERNTTATETVRAVSKKVEKSGGKYSHSLHLFYLYYLT